MKKLIVAGAGPAGISTALYAKRGGLDVTVFYKKEDDKIADGALQKAHKIDNYYGFPGGISGSELFENGIAQAKALGIEVREEEIVGLSFQQNFVVTTTEGDYEADGVCLAMGSTRKAPPVKGLTDFEGHGVSYCAVCDAFFFRGKEVVVLGNGEYAKHEAEVLAPVAGSVTMIAETDVAEILGDTLVQKVVTKEGKEIPAAGVFVACGSAGSTDLAGKLGVACDGNKIIIDETGKTNIPHLYAAGDCVGGLMQISKSVHDGAVAGLTAAKELRG